MRSVFLGPPGAGKGTQAALFCEKRKLAHVSTGELLRQAAREGTPLGKKAAEIMKRGDLVPDDLVLGIAKARLDSADCRTRGFVLDGYPRNVQQAKDLDKVLKDMKQPLSAVVYFEVDRPSLIARLSGRRGCPKCSASYHVTALPPKVAGKCDSCGSALVQREDDRPDSIANRLKVYDEKTKDLIGYYKALKLLVTVPSNGGIEEIAASLELKLKGIA